MNLRRLHYFCEIVDSGSAVVAAGRLHVAPTALSMQLGRLEDELGGELFDRSRRPMELTALGSYFHPRARALLMDARRLEEETRSVAAGQSGVLAIGYTRSSIFSILPRAIRTFRINHPQVKVELMTLLSEHQHTQLQTGRIQLGISRYLGPVDEVDGLAFTHLLDDPFVIALPSGHAFSRRKSVRASEMDDVPFITYPKDPQSTFAEHTIELLRAAGGIPVIAHEANDIHTALGMVASGLGYCMVGRSVCEGNRRDVVFTDLSGCRGKATVMAVTKASDSSKLVAAFLRALLTSVAPQAGP
jgi:DNA-binding transcriptional LysR family regulator